MVGLRAAPVQLLEHQRLLNLLLRPPHLASPLGLLQPQIRVHLLECLENQRLRARPACLVVLSQRRAHLGSVLEPQLHHRPNRRLYLDKVSRGHRYSVTRRHHNPLLLSLSVNPLRPLSQGPPLRTPLHQNLLMLPHLPSLLAPRLSRLSPSRQNLSLDLQLTPNPLRALA